MHSRSRASVGRMFRAVYGNIIPVSEFCDFKRRQKSCHHQSIGRALRNAKRWPNDDLSIKLLYQELADRWYDLAKQIERYGAGLANREWWAIGSGPSDS